MLNISKEICVGWDNTKFISNLHEATILPIGDSAKEIKAIGRLSEKVTDIKEYNNYPLPGFTLHNVSRKRFSTAEDTWLVMDPRGFITNISQNNMSNILRVTGITEGLIQERCVWARDDDSTSMILLPVSSKEYEAATENTKLLEEQVLISDVKIGDTVYLQNELTGVYLGVMSLYTTATESKTYVKSQSLLRKHVIEVDSGRFFYSSDPKILKIVKKGSGSLSRDDAILYVNNAIATTSTYFSQYKNVAKGGYYSHSSSARIARVAKAAVSSVPFLISEISKTEADALFIRSMLYNDIGYLLLETASGKQYLLDQRWWVHQPVTSSDFYVRPIIDILPDRITFRPNEHAHTDKTRVSIDNFKKFYKIVKSVKNDTYI